MRAIGGRSLSAAQPLLGGRSCLDRSSTVVRAAQEAGIKDRAVAAAPYLVPLFDSLRYGKFALAQNPILYKLLAPLDPLIRLYTTVPFASLITFFAIYILVINNRETWSRYVRFNAMQAVLLDIVLILPGVFEQVLKPPMSGFGLTIYINIYNTIFFFVLACWLYGSGACLLGKTARLPLVADAADQQVPF